MVIQIKVSSLLWTIFSLPLFPLTLVPWLFNKGVNNNSGWWDVGLVVACLGTAVSVMIYALSMASAYMVVDVQPLVVETAVSDSSAISNKIEKIQSFLKEAETSQDPTIKLVYQNLAQSAEWKAADQADQEALQKLRLQPKTKFEVTMMEASVISFMPWSWSVTKTYIRCESTDGNVYWINPQTKTSFLNHKWESAFKQCLAQSLSSDEINAILAD